MPRTAADVGAGFHEAGDIEDDLLPELFLVLLLHRFQHDGRAGNDDGANEAEADRDDQRVGNAVAIEFFLVRHCVSASA